MKFGEVLFFASLALSPYVLLSAPAPATATAPYSVRVIRLAPPASSISGAVKIDASAQVGNAYFGGSAHAGMWRGTADSWVDLHPSGANQSYAQAVAGGQQAGAAYFGVASHAGLWTGTAASWVDVHPANAASSTVEATDGLQQVGSAVSRGINGACLWSGTAQSWVNLHPPMLGALSLFELKDASSLAAKLKTPPEAVSTYVQSRLRAITRTELESWQPPAIPSERLKVLLVEDLNAIMEGDPIWDETTFQGVILRPETQALVDLNPLGLPDSLSDEEEMRMNRLLLEDAYPIELSKERRFAYGDPWNSVAHAVAQGQQAGSASFEYGPHPVVWHGSAVSWVDLLPSAVPGWDLIPSGEIFATTGSQQAGYVLRYADGQNPAQVACRWSGTPESFVSLHPAGAEDSGAFALTDSVQAGYAVFGGVRQAGIWTGTSNTWFSLHPFLVQDDPRAESSARGVWSDGTRIYVVGSGNQTTGAVLWELTPRSTSDNQSPTIQQVSDRLIYRGQTLTVALQVYDPDGPGTQFTFALSEAAPGMVLDSDTGILTWTPDASVPAGNYRITMTVTDDGTPPLSDTGSFRVTLRDPRFHVTTVILDRDDALDSSAESATVGLQAGQTGYKACLWTGTPESLVMLGPTGSGSSSVSDTSGNQQAGSAWFQNTQHAGYWSGTRASWVDLHPPGASQSSASATDGSQQGGSVNSHAALWSGTAASWIDLHPPGATTSEISAMANGEQAGRAEFPASSVPGFPTPNQTHAGIWSGSVDSWIDLHPASAEWSEIRDTSGSQQVGTVDSRATLWSGTAASAVSLHPEGASSSTALGTIDVFQCGGVALGSGGTHAGIWTGTADSWFDLDAYLGGSVAWSNARDLTFSGPDIHVVGSFQPTGANGSKAVLWILTPIPDPLAPLLTVPEDTTIAEGTSWSGQLQATASAPGQSVRFSLVSGPPDLTLDPVTGIMAWSPTELSGPKTHVVTVRATDDNSPPNVTVGSFRIQVTEVNRPPVLTVPANLSLVRGNSLVLTNLAASDPDFPRNKLRFSLVAPPPGMTMNATNGWIAWQTTASHAIGIHTINVQVSDQGSPALSVIQSFTIDLKPLEFSVRVVFLDPMDSRQSSANAVNESRQAGFFQMYNGPQQAVLWQGSRTSWINLNPQGSTGSEVADMEGNQQVGYASFLDPNDNQIHGHAGLWSGTAGSWLDLHPPGIYSSYATSLSGNHQGGTANGHAALWSGSAASWVDLNPPGASSSNIHDIAGDQQVGTAAFPGQNFRAILWHGTPESWVDLTPSVAHSAYATATTGAQQAGYVYLAYAPDRTARHASVWSGTADSWRDLHPPGALESFLNGAAGSLQVGRATLRNPNSVQTLANHALLWNGTADSWTDLHAALGEGFNSSSEAHAVWSDGSQIRVVGMLRNGGTEKAVLWILSPIGSDALRLTGPDDTVVPEGVPVALQATSSYPQPSGNLRYSLVSGPPDMWVNPITGGLSWSPTEAHGPGIYSVTVRVMDDGYPPLSDTRAFRLTVAEVNSRPTLATIPDLEVAPGESLMFQTSASDPDLPANALVYSLTTFPTGMTIDAVSGLLTWNPAGDSTLGDWDVTVQVDDQGTPPLTDLRSFVVRVHHRAPPVAYPDTLQRKPGQGTKVRVATLTANDVDPDQQPLTLVELQSPTLMGGTALLESGWIFYQPPAGFDPATDSFTYRIRDASGYESESTVTVSIAQAGTESSLNILSVSGGYPNPAMVRFAGIPRRTYVVQSSPSFNPPVWRTLGSITVPSNGIAEFQDPEAATQPVLFYRTLAP